MVAVVAVLIPILLGIAGFAIDFGRAATTRRDTQNAADAAALAGADVLLAGGSASQAKAAAFTWSQNNGYASSETTVNIPPLSGAHAGNNSYAEVIIQHAVATSFERALHIDVINISSRAVAGFVPVPKNYALLVLDPTMCSGYSQSSSALTINGGGAMVNSSCQPSASQGGGSTLTAQFINYFQAGSWLLSSNATTSVPPAPIGGQISDPLASLAQPIPCDASGQPIGCISGSPDSSGTANNPQVTHITGNNPVTLHPGTYYGGIQIDGSGTITLQPGLYVLAGGGLTYSTTASITGSGVTIFNTYDPYHNSGAGVCGSISLQGNGTLSLTAPTSDPYKNMLFWQDPACTNQMKYAGSTYTTSGIIYLPKAQLNISGGGSLGALQIIVDSFSLSGSASVTINYGNYVQISQPRVALIE